MYLGINLSHGSSACLIDSEGRLVAALEEERLSRVKNHCGIPALAINHLLSNAPPNFDLKEIVHGSFQELSEDSLHRILANIENSPSNPVGSWRSPRPGWKRPSGDAHLLVEKTIALEIEKVGFKAPNQIWVKHHDAHLGTALASALRSDKKNTLLVTLDGEGDGESGVVAIAAKGSPMLRLSSTSSLDSLGYLYQSVTERYNFKGNQHEGKITGLAAFGKQSAAVEVLSNFVRVQDGRVSINYAKSKSKNRLHRAIQKIGLHPRYALSLDHIIDLAASQTQNYEDLAFAVQQILEDSVLEIVSYWLKEAGAKNLSVSGGVFANVKLNQRISEIPNLAFFDVFPNMGDGGLSAGGVWAHLSKKGELTTDKPYSDMYLAKQHDLISDYANSSDLLIEKMETRLLARKAATLISQGKFVGLHYADMEFGPRALGHRSLLLDPRDREILNVANKRLKRTEFMPFAPVVIDSEFKKFFEGDLTARPGFEFMTVTCRVKEEGWELIPAVTHVDRTARPQVIKYLENDLYSEILLEFGNLTGISVLVNTSLNVHEQPINFNLKDSIECLLSGAIDYIVTENHLISRKS